MTATHIDLSCDASATVVAIPHAQGLRFESGRRAVRLFTDIEVSRCDRDHDDMHRHTDYVDLTVEQAEELAWLVLTAVADLRSTEEA